MKIIKDNPTFPWDYQYISGNPNITWQDVLDNPHDPDNIAKVRAKVAELTKRFPVYG